MATEKTRQWWADAVIYQLYPRSFADGDGDGIGDIEGIRARLPYLKDLGVDAIWINPWYPSPMVDAGYDVADYYGVEPMFGTLETAQKLIDEAHAAGIKIILDIVPNHTSDKHAWFRAALEAGPGSPEREKYWFRPGKGKSGELPPNDWTSTMGMGTPAWTRIAEPDGTPGEWYLHLFSPQQPDLNWDSREVRDGFLDILRFWFDRGVDGFRIDVAMALAKDPALPDYGLGSDDSVLAVGSVDVHPHFDRDEVQDIYREWRRVADSYPEQKLFVAEAWVLDSERYRRYLAPGVLHTAFNFGYLMSGWDAGEFKTAITKSLREHEPLDSPPTWVLSNHDVIRHLSRFGRPEERQTKGPSQHFTTPLDLALGTRRARAAAMLNLSLPGGVYVYQGEELGLWEVEDIPAELRQDPVFERSEHADPGRDGCRVPLPWSGDTAPFGFSPDDATSEPWLPQPAAWRDYTVERELADEGSMLSLYRQLIGIRAEHHAWAGEELQWLEAPDGVLAFRRGTFVCAVNFAGDARPFPSGGAVLAASREYDGATLPADTAVWIERT